MFLNNDYNSSVPDSSLMLCCSAHALRTFHVVWKNAVHGRYAELGPVPAGSECSLEFDLNERTTEEKEYVFLDKDCARLEAARTWQVRWRGNTVIEVQPTSKEEKRLYKRQHLDTDRIEYRQVSYFLPRRSIGW